ncbi:hypothetical protein [Cellulomonas sp. IC4_254]|uniref:alpha/beta hydrolase family protein n=1 Tax=Cellulomonas sp. IC4_254 TaxID=2714040 RepID=UPI00141E0CD3|nr:hypothetical protein [Cellulomonas sp. IC4_254]NHT16118.1 hypothetical protein [Cellulomonas sp. IC4_254]
MTMHTTPAQAQDRRAYWSTESNPQTGRKFEAALGSLRVAHNGGADIDALLDTDYGARFAEDLELGFRFEEDPTGRDVEEYYRGLGLRRQMFENSDYYTRWLLITPLELEDVAAEGGRYPVVFVNHGGFCSISTDEFISGFPRVAARERIIVAMLQDTNPANTQRVLDRLIELYPVDTERVYLVGESQGGYQATSTYFRAPERFAAVVTCGNDIWRDWDNVNTPFSDQEIAHVTETFVPFMQIVGQFEASGFAPVNDWHPRKDWGAGDGPEPYHDPRRDDERDPTRNVNGPRRFSTQPSPPEGVDKHEWMLARLNKRMATLSCAPRDPGICIGYLDNPDTELHGVLGFYGDRERTETILGVTHWISDIDNAAGINAFRYVVVANAPHCWPATAADLAWEFMATFRRDARTGSIVVDERQTHHTTTAAGAQTPPA